mmetsp:Transcript_3393/g.7941  ORF Transcript_3393/g.7941 Transcript_3393/m.7941 type:complete len:508 (+) Transcript_3393:2004-3527(+)
MSFFLHSLSGREGLLDTAVKTCKSGYLQRVITKNIESIFSNRDGTLRDSESLNVIDFLNHRSITDFSRLANNAFAITNKMFVETIGDDTKNIMIKQQSKLKYWFFNIFKLICEDNVISKYGSETTREEARDNYQALKKNVVINLLNENISESTLTEFKGILASQSIGEPLTQMTLNTFHNTGVVEGGVTVGIPKLIKLLQNIGTVYFERNLVKDLIKNKNRFNNITNFVMAINFQIPYIDFFDSIQLECYCFKKNGFFCSKIVKMRKQSILNNCLKFNYYGISLVAIKNIVRNACHLIYKKIKRVLKPLIMKKLYKDKGKKKLANRDNIIIKKKGYTYSMSKHLEKASRKVADPLYKIFHTSTISFYRYLKDVLPIKTILDQKNFQVSSNLFISSSKLYEFFSCCSKMNINSKYFGKNSKSISYDTITGSTYCINYIFDLLDSFYLNNYTNINYRIVNNLIVNAYYFGIEACHTLIFLEIINILNIHNIFVFSDILLILSQFMTHKV